MADYVFNHDNPLEEGRLTLLEKYVNPLTFATLARLRVRDGWRCADLGAGRGAVSAWLSDRVHPTGHVTAVDTDTRYLTPKPNLAVQAQDAIEFAALNSHFDLVVIRFLLVHLDPAHREALLSNARTLLRAGGILLVVESDYSPWIQLSLGDPALDRVRAAYIAAVQQAGWNLALGRQIPATLEALGYTNVQSEGTSHYDRAGSPMCRLLAESVRVLTSRIQTTGIATQSDVDYFCEELTNGERGFFYVTTWATTGLAPHLPTLS